jgi:hypothetical protein
MAPALANIGTARSRFRGPAARLLHCGWESDVVGKEPDRPDLALLDAKPLHDRDGACRDIGDDVVDDADLVTVNEIPLEPGCDEDGSQLS